MRNRFQRLFALLTAVLLCLYPVSASASSGGAVSSGGPADSDGQKNSGKAGTGTVSSAPIAAGFLHSAVIKEDGTLWMAGANTYGQLGNGRDGVSGETSSLLESDASAAEGTPFEDSSDQENSADSTKFIQVMENVKAVYAGYLDTFAIDGNNTLWVWGWDEGGQLGLGAAKDVQNAPVALLEDVVMAAPGEYHSAAVTADGALWTWGWNDVGQLGRDSDLSEGEYDPKEKLHKPQKALDDVRTVALGLKHTLAVKNDNTLWACGDNSYGQLGDGGNSAKPSFEKIMGNVQDVAATAFGSLILKTDGTLWACGYNNHGEIGNGTLEDVASPVQILDAAAQVAASREFAAAVGKDGTLYAWGSNAYGQYGGETSAEPMAVDTDVSYVSTGGGHILYLKDSTVYACGNNERGQFGSGTTDNAATALPVMEDVSVAPKTASSFPGTVVAVVIIIAAVLLIFAFLIVRTLRNKPGKGPEKPKKKKPVQESPEEDLSKLSDRELLRMAEAMNASSPEETGEEDPPRTKPE